MESILNNDSTKSRFCRELKTYRGSIRFAPSSLSYCVLYGHNIAFFLLGFHFYGSDIFIVPMGFFGAFEEAKFGAVLYLITVISMFLPFLSGDVVGV